jgi:hypothetical protein
MRTKTELQIDAAFIRRVYPTSLVVWAFVALMVYARWGVTPAIGLTLGTALALGSLRALEWAIRTLIVPGASPKAGHRVVALGMLKMLLVGAILIAVIVIAQRLQANLLLLLLGIVGGFFLVHLVMVLKAVGIWMLDQGMKVDAGRQTPGAGPSEADTG